DHYHTGANPGDEWTEGDFNGDGTVGNADYTIWADNYTGTAASIYAEDPLVTPPARQSFRYALWGVPRLRLCDTGHQGLRHDPEFGLIYNRARMYSPRHQRFWQRDPAGYVDGMSLCAYMSSRPSKFLDPSGKRKKTCEVVPGHYRDLDPRWLIIAIVPGEGVSDSIGRGARLPKAILARRYVELFKCCDSNDCVETRWGKPATAIGEEKTTGDPADAMPTRDVTLTLSLPIGFGQSMPVFSMGYSAWASPVSFAGVDWTRSPDHGTIKWTAYEDQVPAGYSLVDHITCDTRPWTWPGEPPVPQVTPINPEPWVPSWP
ncbi:MAG: hypothetical protein GF393_03135, partial [Armatimonadia bacterium]|nr:hypothetical protein [Armatimonadia bacterium]